MEEGLARRLVQVGLRAIHPDHRAQFARFGVEAIEEGTNWIWIRREDGQFGYKFGERDTFGGWGVLGGEEAFYGPMTEVL